MTTGIEKTLHFETALTSTGWQKDVAITVDPNGWITAVVENVSGADADEAHAIGVPGMVNLHSHAFQRAMAGLTERRDNPRDSFWTWRTWMYRFVDQLTPDDLLVIAQLTYAEMLEAGFTGVCEFHYVHHAPDGRPYDDVAAMSAAICEAAATTGMGLTLLPVFYEQGGFDGRPPSDAQQRFANLPDTYETLFEAAEKHITALPDACMGIAPHSLRATSPTSLTQLLQSHPTGPVHIHIAEQTAEVDDCVAWSGARPVAWLMDHATVDGRWCLVHATHISQDEIRAIATSGATVGLCPITEANLGDGIFPASTYEGTFGIGSDSNVLIGLAAELSLLEYGQRLRDRSRSVLAQTGGSVGGNLFRKSLAGGMATSGRKTGCLALDYRADIVALNASHPALAARRGDALLDGWIFAGDNTVIDTVWVGGVKQVTGGHHKIRDPLRQKFNATLTHLIQEA